MCIYIYMWCISFSTITHTVLHRSHKPLHTSLTYTVTLTQVSHTRHTNTPLHMSHIHTITQRAHCYYSIVVKVWWTYWSEQGSWDLVASQTHCQRLWSWRLLRQGAESEECGGNWELRQHPLPPRCQGCGCN